MEAQASATHRGVLFRSAGSSGAVSAPVFLAVGVVRTETLTESKVFSIELADDQAEALSALGRKLASDRAWWGRSGDEDIENERRTVLRCSPITAGLWSVYVSNAVGTVTTRDLQLIVEPKIPADHLFYLMGRSESWPRMDKSLAPLQRDRSLFSLVVRWFLNATERLLRSELMEDYRETRYDVEAVRGQLEAMGTAHLYYAGRLAAACVFEEFDVDTPLNRTLKAAARAVLRDPTMEPASRRRAERLVVRMDGVGPLQFGDLRVPIDRRTSSYHDPIVLARHIIGAQGRALAAGDVSARAFLIRTPELIEEGVRKVLAEGMTKLCSVKKEGRQLPETTMTINPDLCFGQVAIGDIKYKLNWTSWSRADLYQSVAFAVGFGRNRALIVSFCDDHRDALGPVWFGDVRVDHALWRAVPQLSSWHGCGAAGEPGTELVDLVRSFAELISHGNELPAVGLPEVVRLSPKYHLPSTLRSWSKLDLGLSSGRSTTRSSVAPSEPKERPWTTF